MIVLPAEYAPREANPFLIDPGGVLRGGTGGAAGRLNRPGARWGVEVTMPTMSHEKARAFAALMTLAKRDGLRLTLPLGGGEVQGGGAGTVDGSGAAGTSLPVEGLTPGFMLRLGHWLTVENAAGERFVHQVAAPVRIGTDGKATITLTTALLTELADGDTVLVSKPTIEGVVTSDVNWVLPVNRRVGGLSFRVEESDPSS